MKLDSAFIQPFLDGTITTLKVQCQMEATMTKPYIKGTGSEKPGQVDIAGMLGITSDQFKGSMSLCFPEKTFLAIMGNMLGETYTTITPDVEDGAGELINIIFGYAKRVLNEKGCTIQKALPTIVRGSAITVHHLPKGPIMVLPFTTNNGPFHIEIATTPAHSAAAA